MFSVKLSTCPSCGARMERGFSVRNHGLSWITAEKIKQFTLLDTDLNQAGMQQYLPSRAAYDLSYLCPNCKIYIVDYGKSFSTSEARELAEYL